MAEREEVTYFDAQSDVFADEEEEEQRQQKQQEEGEESGQHAVRSCIRPSPIQRRPDKSAVKFALNTDNPADGATDCKASDAVQALENKLLLEEACRRMRTGGTHKTSAERLLVTARSRVNAARDALDEESGRQVARELLELADKSLRAAEVQLGSERFEHSGGSACSSSHLSFARRSGSIIDELGDDDQLSPSTSLDMRTRKWLVETFTDQDLEAADTHGHIMQSPTYSPRRVRRQRHKSFGRDDENISLALDEPHVKELLCRAGHFDFNALAFAGKVDRPISVLAAFVFQESNTVKGLHEEGCLLDDAAFKQRLLCFFGRVDRLYGPAAVYHGEAHACDVMATTEWLLRSSYIRARTTLLDHFLSVVASAVHDVGHPGTTNLFQQVTMAPLALRYNDKSILENMHVATAFELMQNNPECNWFKLFCRENSNSECAQNIQQYVRKGLIEMVLATDMAKHTKHVSDLVEFVREETCEEGAGRSPTWEEMDRQKALDMKLFLLATVLHAADISNPCKPREVMVGWTKRVLTEFWAQGDEERRLGLEVSPLCDRESGQKAVPKGQIGFINFVVQPFFSPLVRLIPEVQEAVDCLDDNKKFWQEKARAKADFESIFADVS